MNTAFLRRLQRVLQGDGFLPSDAYKALRREIARRLAGPRAAWLEPFWTADIRPLPPKAQRLLDTLPLAQTPSPDALSHASLDALNEFFAPKRKPSGIFYTPWPVAQHLARAALYCLLTRRAGLTEPDARRLLTQPALPRGIDAPRLDDCLAHLTLCDPAAGAGGLLLPLALELANLRTRLNPTLNTGETLSFLFTHTLYAGDISAAALADLQLRAAVLLAQAGVQPPLQPIPHRLLGNALAAQNGQSIWEQTFAQVAQNGGFDLVISNPPYVGQKHHRDVFEPLRQNPLWQPYAQAKSDLLYFFFYLALRLLKEGGIGAFLTPPSFASAAAAKTLRTQLRTQTALLYLQDFGEKHLFGAAAGEHSLITVLEKNTGPDKPLCRVGETTLAQERLYQGPDLFLQTRPLPAAALASALSKMAAAPRTLGQVARVSNGLMTGCDKISAAHLRRFALPGVHKGDGVFVLSCAEKESLCLSALERQKLKPFFKNSDISSYTAARQPQNWLVDFFYPNDRELDFARYPRLRAHLARFRPVLLARKQNNNGIHKLLAKGIYWFGSVRRKMNFETDKIVAPQRAGTNKFAFAPGPWYASSDVYFISHPQEGISLWCLLGLLNSAPYFAWLSNRGKRKGRLLELYSAPLKAIPIPAATPAQQKRLETLARQIYQLKSTDPHADTSALQKQLDALVCALFGFTQEELKTVCTLRPTP